MAERKQDGQEIASDSDRRPASPGGTGDWFFGEVVRMKPWERRFVVAAMLGIGVAAVWYLRAIALAVADVAVAVKGG